MGIPTYDQWIEPILKILARHPDGMPAKDAHDQAAEELGLTDDERAELLPSGVQRVYKNRAGWAHDRLKRAGLSSSPRRGFWRLTSEGLTYAGEHQGPLPPDEVERLAQTYKQVVRLGPRPDATPAPEQAEVSSDASDAGSESPDDALERSLLEIRESVSAELLELMHNSSPEFFETLVLDVLHAMGYGTTRGDVQRLGRSGDGGVDGVISLDRLGLEKVYVQAKRWKDQVGRPQVQAFYGALAGQRANKGVMIATSNFSLQAIEFAASVERLVLVDGQRLAQLMIEHGVGVTHRLLRVPKLDSDYFEE